MIAVLRRDGGHCASHAEDVPTTLDARRSTSDAGRQPTLTMRPPWPVEEAAEDEPTVQFPRLHWQEVMQRRMGDELQRAAVQASAPPASSRLGQLA
jgi:hypothetical protein